MTFCIETIQEFQYINICQFLFKKKFKKSKMMYGSDPFAILFIALVFAVALIVALVAYIFGREKQCYILGC